MSDFDKFNIKVGEDHEDEDNIICTSLVDDPATQRMFAVFSDQKNENLQFQTLNLPAEANKQKIGSKNGKFERVVSGVWFMPETDYFRSIDDYYFTTSITREELKRAATNFMKSGAVNNFNIMHDGIPVEGLRPIEVWILDEYEQRSPILNNSLEDLGYKKENIPLGTVFMSVFVENEQFFNDEIQTGNLKGFSIEAFFILEQKFNKQTMGKQKEMFAKIGLLQATGKLIVPEKGTLDFQNDKIELDGKTVVDGDFKLNTGFSIVIRDGKVKEFGFENEGGDPPATDGGGDNAGGDDNPPADPPATDDEPEVNDKPNNDDIDAKIAAGVDAILKKRDAEAKADKEKKEAEAARQKEIDDLKKENEELKAGQKIPKSKSLVSENPDYDKSKFREVTRGGKKHLILK